MNKQEFYAASLARDKVLEKQTKWLLYALLTVLTLPLLILMAIPDDCILASTRQIFGYTAMGLIVCCFIASIYIIRYYQKRTNIKFDLICHSCGVPFEGNSLIAVGFTDSCEKCGTNLFNDPDHSLKIGGSQL